MTLLTEQCPWCGSEISHGKFLEVQAKIRSEEKKRLAETEAAMRVRLDAELSQKLQAQKATLEKEAKDASDRRVASFILEKERALKRVKEVEAREAVVRKQAQDEGERKAKAQMEEQQRKQQKELAEQRLILERDRDQALLKKQAEFNREGEAFQKKILEMDRQLQRKTANEMGDGAEIDLFETLRECFPDDRITRIKKGHAGADVLFEVIHKGEPCGRIVIDSKNRQAWHYAFVAKLRQDQQEAKAEHAILSTTVFPSGKKELCIESSVIVVSPGRVIHIVTLLRQALVSLHIRGLSVKERAGKMNSLYNFITSPAFSQRFIEASRLADDILELDVQEKKSHDIVWKKRGALATRLNNVLREVDTDIASIVEGAEGSEMALETEEAV